jgi:hypothetical protein
LNLYKQVGSRIVASIYFREESVISAAGCEDPVSINVGSNIYVSCHAHRRRVNHHARPGLNQQKNGAHALF